MIGAVVQARMSSERLPGKVLREMAGKPTLQYVLERLERADEPDLVVVATSVAPADAAIEELCNRLEVNVYRGPLEDVAQRYAEVAEMLDLEAFARVTADSPLLDQRVVDRAVKLFREGDFDVVTNVQPSTFPSGQSVEVVSTKAFRAALPDMTDPDDREHVTKFLYRDPDRFTIENFTAERDDGELDLSLDTEEDATLLEAMLTRMEKPHWEYTSEELVELAQAVRGEEPQAE